MLFNIFLVLITLFIFFKINEHITLKLEKKKTIIYVDGERFMQCKKLLINIPFDKIQEYSQIDNINDAIEIDQSIEQKSGKEKNDITAEQEFWGHCSNLQVWVENNYDTRLLHTNISFPLLKKLADIGEPIARRNFKDEVVSRLLNSEKNLNVAIFLIKQDYLKNFTHGEIESIMDEIHDEQNKLDEYSVLILEALIYFHKENYEQTVAKCKRALKIKSDNKIWSLLSDAYIRMNALKEAKFSLWNTLIVDDRYYSAWHSLGVLYYRNTEFERAKFCFKKCVKINFEFVNAHISLGHVYNKLEKPKKVINHFNKIRSDLLEIEDWIALGTAYSDIESFDDAIICFEKVIEIDPNNMQSLMQIVENCVKFKEFKRLVDPSARIFRITKSLKHFYIIVDSLINFKEIDNAINLCKRILEENIEYKELISQRLNHLNIIKNISEKVEQQE